MRFKILKSGNMFHALFTNTTYRILDKNETKSFILNYELAAKEEPLHDDFPAIFDDYQGIPVAYLDENMCLVIQNPELFRSIMAFDSCEFPYCTSQEFAEMHNHSECHIRKLCKAERIPGAMQIGHCWLIPKDAAYPKDLRAGRDMSKKRRK